MPRRIRAKITGVAGYVPPRVLSNAELEKMVATTDAWIRERTGIRERRIAADGETVTTMAIAAAQQAIDRADMAEGAKRAADRIVEQLKRGAPFGAVAQQFSQGATAQAGGELGDARAHLVAQLQPMVNRAYEDLAAKPTPTDVIYEPEWRRVGHGSKGL